MSRARAAAGTLLFFVLAPGVVAGLVPWLLTRWEAASPLPFWAGLRVGGPCSSPPASGCSSTPSCASPSRGSGRPRRSHRPRTSSSAGFYRWVRNPMYLAVTATIVGQALLLGRTVLFLYALGVSIAFVAFVRAYEEPALARRFGPEYEAYRRDVPGWWPRRPR